MQKKYVIASLVLLLIIIPAGLYLSAIESMGVEPNDKHKKLFYSSNNYSQDRDQFININQALIDKRMEEGIPFKKLKSFFLDGDKRSPNNKLPEVKPDFSNFLSGDKPFKVIWFGHSSFLLNMDGMVILVDPVFGAAAPLEFLKPRYQDAVVQAEDLPEIDYILISHDHYDHLEMDTVKFFAGKPVKFIVPLGVSSYLQGWGVNSDHIIELDWWEETVQQGIIFTATPSQHFSGRNLSNGAQTLWASWVMTSSNYNVFFSGDTGYHDQFKDIGERLGPFDIAFMENGQYDESWREVHLFPEESIIAFKALRAKRYFPIHWGMFDLALHTWNQPMITTHQLTQENNIPMVAPIIGEVVDLDSGDIKLRPWWE